MWSRKHSVFLLTCILFSMFQAHTFAEKKPYIVYLGSHAHGPEVTDAHFDRVTDSHYDFLSSFLGSYEKAKEAIFDSYQRHINGFAAMLEEEEASGIRKHPGVVSVFLNRARKLHTTHSWEFMLQEKDGAIKPSSLLSKAKLGEDVIIANLDTGVWPESPSFNDEGMGPIPSRWKGICDQGKDGTPFRCNRKLIGARYFNKGYGQYVSPLPAKFKSPRDTEGHGSHTLSTVGGNFVRGASVFGFGNGTAHGGSPRARVAAYKVCWPVVNHAGGCYDSDIMQAIDMAIHDGVDVLSVSLGGEPAEFFEDGIAIGAFHAFRHGINVVMSGGNSGPTPGTITNVAPWVITVAASTIDREFDSIVELKNGEKFKGTSLSGAMPEKKFYPLITAAQAQAANNTNNYNASICIPGTLDPEKIKGKILVCTRGVSPRVEKGFVAAQAGAAGMILCNDKLSNNELISDPHMVPASQLSYSDCLALFSYIYSTKNPLGYIMPPITKFQTKPSPFMASFSSRGPNSVTPELLKPDITAPGVNIIAAFTEAISPTEEEYDTRRVPFLTMSGTSMSCPHVAGIVGLLKSLHPEWSSAAIKSAIMTTARTRDNTVHPMLDGDFTTATPFAYGAGHIRPNRAMDPGLVYDLTVHDYLNFLCATGYNKTHMAYFIKRPYPCPKSANILDFNYPSITIPELYGSVTVTRKLKNVGSAGTYVASTRAPKGISITLKPNTLKFHKIGEEKSFKMTISVDEPRLKTAFAGLTWSDGKHNVRSPIVIGGIRD
ncbi:hypothetical protein L6164_036070 [Bauhinia variegata]|uniref:Uncharacterized protein n=1 Tax=Bauhinia variegata TaxID=167791 RepID=A0ACB9KFY7_BAUVA|nr:hypothetical protein L6164_036070 [Bauhinia variegata]